MSPNGFFDISIRQIINGYKTGELSPDYIANLCISQYEKTEPVCLAWERFDKKMLLERAADAGKRITDKKPIRSLEGIPVGVKDIFNTSDFPTEMGSPIWKNFTPGNDARVVHYLKYAGAIIPGKTVTAEFAVHTLGKTRNPHDTTRTPGTSSSGSAVSVATGMIPASIGTQTAGSIVRPASFCGIYGCKPSFGLIPRTGMLKTTDSLDSIGFFTLHFEDLEYLFEIIRVHGSDYPLSNRALLNTEKQNKPSGGPWRIALVKTHTWEYAADYAKHALFSWYEKIAGLKDVTISEAQVPSSMEKSHEVHATIYDKTLSYYFKNEFQKDTLVSPIMKTLILHGNTISNAQYQDALVQQNHMAKEMDNFFGQYDILISLSTAGEAPLRDDTEQPDSALIWTMTHLPVICAPVFISPKGLPFGAQIVSRRYNDYRLFKFCNLLNKSGLLPERSNPDLSIKNQRFN